MVKNIKFNKLISIVKWFLVTSMYLIIETHLSILHAQCKIIDLASDNEWTARIDGGTSRPIVVPGGGWNSDKQSPRIHILNDVNDYVEYERLVSVPTVYPDQNVVIQFGAVNYGAEVYVNDCLVMTHAGAQIPFEADVTRFVKGRSEFHLKVKAYHRRHYDRNGINLLPIGWEWPDGRATPPWGWKKDAPAQLSKMGYGITKYIHLVIYPSCYIKDVFLQPSVSSQSLTYDVWVYNGSDKQKDFVLCSNLSSWNKQDWHYPDIDSVHLQVKAHTLEKVSVRSIPWTLGPESYWWPNIPFEENYRTQLHWLHLKLNEGETTYHNLDQRFGFCEHTEGKYYYMVNGVRVNGFGDGTAENQMSYYDCYSTAPAFLPPTETSKGCPETWKRYMRIGFNTVRLHCSVPTQYMMDVADELGFMLIPESPLWGNKRSIYHPQYTPHTIKSMIGFCRNHPSVVRYSLTNEVREPMTEHWSWRGLIDAAYEVDPTRPFVYELHQFDTFDRVDGYKYGHAYIMDHYSPAKRSDNSHIRGMGEQFWGTNKMEEFATGVQLYRLYDYAYVAPWSWINYWPNFLEGMDHEHHAWTPNNHADRIDGVDGWESDVVRSVQLGLHPFLVMDTDFKWNVEFKTLEEEVSEIGRSKMMMPVDTVSCGSTLVRQIELFNGGLSDDKFSLEWKWEDSQGKTVAKGESALLYLRAGFHAPVKIEIPIPMKSSLYKMTLRNKKKGNVVCTNTYYIYVH